MRRAWQSGGFWEGECGGRERLVLLAALDFCFSIKSFKSLNLGDINQILGSVPYSFPFSALLYQSFGAWLYLRSVLGVQL